MSLWSKVKSKVKRAYTKVTRSANRSAKTQKTRKTHQTNHSSRSTGTSQHRGGSNAKSNQTATRNAYTRRASGGSSSNRGSSSSWGSNRSGGTAQHRGTAQKRSGSSQSTKKQNQTSWQAFVQNTLKSAQNSSAKSAQEAYQKKVGENRNALGARVQTRTSGKLKSEDLTSEDYLRLQNASRMGKKAGNAALGKDLAEKVGSRTAYSANRNRASRAATGVMQGLAYGDVIEGGVGTYNKAAREELNKAKKSAAYNVGYGAGQMAGFALGGTSGAAKSLVSGGAKAAAKAGAKKTAESTAKKFIKNRAAEAAVETPMNIADAIKMSQDENGKIDKKKFAGYAALNTGLTVGAGAAMEGAAIKFTKKNGKELLRLQAKANKGTITKEEGQKLKKLYDKLNNAKSDTAAAKSNAADEAYTKGREMVDQARLDKKKAKGAARFEEVRKGRTETQNAKVDRAVAQSNESAHQIQNARTNEKVQRYVDEVNARNEQAAQDNALVYNNSDRISEGEFTDARSNKVPDITAPPSGKRANQNAAKSARKSTREKLASKTKSEVKYSKEETKEINDSVDRITNMLAHGDEADARAEAENLVNKYGYIDREIEEEVPDAARIRQIQHQARQDLYNIPINIQDSRTIRQFLEMYGTTPEELGRKIPLRKDNRGLQTEGMDEVYPRLSEQYPELFPQTTDLNERWQNVIDVALSKSDDIPLTEVRELSDEDIDSVFKELVDDVMRDAQANADSMKDVPKPKETPKETPKAKETPKPKEAPAAEPKAKPEEKPEPKAESEKPEEPRDVSNPSAKEKPEVKKALEGSKKHEEYVNKPRAEQIKEQRPSLEEFKKQVDAGEMSGYETSKHLETIYNAGHYDVKEIKTQLEKDLKAGSYVKVNRESHADAIARAEKSVEEDWKKAYDRQISKSEWEDLTAYDYAERKFVMEKLEDMIRKGEGDVDDLVKRHRDLSINEVLTASNTGAALNAAKIMKRMTPAGRAQLMLKKVEKLNEKFGDRMNGNKLELTDEQYNKILKAESEEDAAKALDEISDELMQQIPSTVFEKLNEIRRFTMLANIRTHERNVIGNTVFAGARSLSDALEVAAYKIPAVRNRVEKLGGVTEMNKLSYRKTIKENREFLDDQFKKVYEGSGSQTQYKDVFQTGQPQAFKSKRINKILDANYAALEKEDMLMFKPTFRKAYAQWCDARGIKDMSQMTEQQMEQAGRYALYKAEYATFRDDSMFARKICGYKAKSAGRKGKTALGTAGYRAANMAIEGHLPFVKTPVNILRRSIDYSPLGIAKGISKLAKCDSAEAFKDGIHEICSGMTGTGAAMFGALLASQGVVTTQAGKVSGDAYYDRDMGYQDYSLVVGPGDKKYSLSIDWASPMQTALFMGAAMHDKLEEDGFSMQDIMDIGVKVFNPMLDMSFMSTSKDTFDSFMDKVYRNGTGDNADWTGAITQTLFGKVPQGYLGSLVPQMVSQAAAGSDKYQRDTRSTKEDAVSASWESWGRQLANKIPVLRQTVNNPKVDRFGQDKTNTGGDNIVLRFVNSMLNPSNMKRITLNDTDRELISIFNKIPEGTTQKNYFFYDFTGNPDYELANGKRMSYNELYKYGKTKRQSQIDSIQTMFDAKSYKNMTNDMKVDEIVKYKKDISTIQADMKVYGADYTLEKIIGGDNVPNDKRKGGKADSTAWKILQNMKGDGEDTKKSFVKFWITKETLMARAHDTGYETKALACAYTGNRDLGRAYDVNTDKMDRAFAYIKEKGKKGGYEMYSDASCNIIAGLDKAQVESTSRPNRSWSAAGYNDIDESTYRAMGFDWNSAQSGAGLRRKYGYDVNQLIQMASDAKYEFDADQNGSLKKDEVISYIDSLGIDDAQHKACLFEYLTGGGVRNPYDSIDDYLKWGEGSRDDEGGYGRRGRGWRRYGRGGWGHGGRGGGGGYAAGGMDWNTYAASIFDMKEPKRSSIRTSRGSGGSSTKIEQSVSDFTKKSELNEAYRKRARKKQLINKK